MCGEIAEWQEAKDVTVRLVTTGARTNVVLSQQFSGVEEIRLNETMITGFNGGTSGAAYLQLFQPGMNNGTSNNEAAHGLLIPYDVLNPHSIYNNPRVISRGNMVNMSQFGIALVLPTTGAPVLFTEASFVLTFVCRRSPDSIAEIRRLKAAMDYPVTTVGLRNTYDPSR
jgi:hypothetical protein